MSIAAFLSNIFTKHTDVRPIYTANVIVKYYVDREALSLTALAHVFVTTTSEQKSVLQSTMFQLTAGFQHDPSSFHQHFPIYWVIEPGVFFNYIRVQSGRMRTIILRRIIKLYMRRVQRKLNCYQPIQWCFKSVFQKFYLFNNMRGEKNKILGMYNVYVNSYPPG